MQSSDGWRWMLSGARVLLRINICSKVKPSPRMFSIWNPSWGIHIWSPARRSQKWKPSCQWFKKSYPPAVYTTYDTIFQCKPMYSEVHQCTSLHQCPMNANIPSYCNVPLYANLFPSTPTYSDVCKCIPTYTTARTHVNLFQLYSSTGCGPSQYSIRSSTNI